MKGVNTKLLYESDLKEQFLEIREFGSRKYVNKNVFQRKVG